MTNEKTYVQEELTKLNHDRQRLEIQVRKLENNLEPFTIEQSSNKSIRYFKDNTIDINAPEIVQDLQKEKAYIQFYTWVLGSLTERLHNPKWDKANQEKRNEERWDYLCKHNN